MQVIFNNQTICDTRAQQAVHRHSQYCPMNQLSFHRDKGAEIESEIIVALASNSNQEREGGGDLTSIQKNHLTPCTMPLELETRVRSGNQSKLLRVVHLEGGKLRKMERTLSNHNRPSRPWYRSQPYVCVCVASRRYGCTPLVRGGGRGGK